MQFTINSIKNIYLSYVTGFVFLSILFCSGVLAANFDIQPIRIVLDEKVKLEKLTIKNVSDTEFPIQIRAYEWSQNEKGEDVYKETKDIIIFPKILTIKKDEEKIIRIGTNIMPGSRERTYRIYLEEMPSPEREAQGASIRLFMKIGIPVFINPPRVEDKAEIDKISVNNGKVEVTVKNKGNNHFMVTGINVRGENTQGMEPFSRDIGGWYLLSGTSKIYETSIPIDLCSNMTNLNVELKTNKSTIKRSVAMDKSMCGRVEKAMCGQDGKAKCGPKVGLLYENR